MKKIWRMFLACQDTKNSEIFFPSFLWAVSSKLLFLFICYKQYFRLSKSCHMDARGFNRPAKICTYLSTKENLTLWKSQDVGLEKSWRLVQEKLTLSHDEDRRFYLLATRSLWHLATTQLLSIGIGLLCIFPEQQEFPLYVFKKCLFNMKHICYVMHSKVNFEMIGIFDIWKKLKRRFINSGFFQNFTAYTTNWKLITLTVIHTWYLNRYSSVLMRN